MISIINFKFLTKIESYFRKAKQLVINLPYLVKYITNTNIPISIKTHEIGE